MPQVSEVIDLPAVDSKMAPPGKDFVPLARRHQLAPATLLAGSMIDNTVSLGWAAAVSRAPWERQGCI